MCACKCFCACACAHMYVYGMGCQWVQCCERVCVSVCESPACASVLASYDTGRMLCADVFLCGMFMAFVCCWRDK